MAGLLDEMRAAQTAQSRGLLSHTPQQRVSGRQVADAMQAMGLLASPIPVVGDVAGLLGDAAMYAAKPEERTVGNAAMTLLGALPFVPSVAGKAKKAAQLLDDSGAPMRLFRGSPNPGGAPYKKDGWVFLTPEKSFAENYARNGKLYEFTAKAEQPFDTTRGDGYKLWKEFEKETNAPSWALAGTSRGPLPYWTIEPQLREWLGKKGIAPDAIWFAESNGTPSVAVRGMDQLSPR